MGEMRGPIQPTRDDTVRHRPGSRGAIAGGLWAQRRRINREVSVPDAWGRLHEAGNFDNLRLAAGLVDGGYVNELPFLDSDLYKWLEAVGWVLADPDLDPSVAGRLRTQLAETENLLRAAQQDDGYLDSHFQVRFPGERFVQLAWGHELYCAGHLIQAAIAVRRSTGEEGLLEVARRFADLVVRSFGLGTDQIDGICGHPEIETALVELYRETRELAYLQTATYFVDRRGHGLLGDDRFGRHYWQDHLPVREAEGVAGHAVRQLYLLAGVADVYAETGDVSLRAAAERLWAEMVAGKTYLTGGIGAHHSDEAFGDPYELPNERSYCETCAAIASIMFCQRLLLITGEAKYADLLERTLYNAFLAGTSLDGQRYIYANPLQVRDDHLGGGGDQDYRRVAWFHCACCPPNVMRLLASLEHYVLLGGDSGSDGGVALHQYVEGRFTAETGRGAVTLEVVTDYPWQGVVAVTVADAPDGEVELALRVPEWAGAASLVVNGDSVGAAPTDGWWVVRRSWVAGDTLRLELPLEVRFTAADPRVDADRGALAVERGPLVYCLESVDHPGHRLDDLLLDQSVPAEEVSGAGPLAGVTLLRLGGQLRSRSVTPDGWWPYRQVTAGYATSEDVASEAGKSLALTAIPYYAWGNREPGAMRIWLPIL